MTTQDVPLDVERLERALRQFELFDTTYAGWARDIAREYAALAPSLDTPARSWREASREIIAEAEAAGVTPDGDPLPLDTPDREPVIDCPWCGGEAYDSIYLGKDGVARHTDCGNNIETDFIESVQSRLARRDPAVQRLVEAARALYRNASIVAAITPEGDRIEPAAESWHDLDDALEYAKAALEGLRHLEQEAG